MNRSEVVHFSIEGEFITNHFRTICLEGNWSRALETLQESLIGFPAELAIKVLSGDMKLVGVNELNLEEDLDSADYKQELLEMYGQYIFIDGIWYKPTAIINTIKPGQDHISDRARIYVPDYDHITFINDNLITLSKKDLYNPPSWLEPQLRKRTQLIETLFRGVIEYGIIADQIEYSSTCEESNLKEIVNYQSERGFICSYDEVEWFMEEDFVQEEVFQRKVLRRQIEREREAAYIQDLRSKIVEQANETGGFIELTYHEETFNVPKIPFYHWCYKHGTHKNYIFDLLPDWNIISPSGLKMGGDDPVHTDFVIGAGFNPEDFYLNESFKSACYRFMHRALDIEVITFAGSGTFEGEIKKVTDDVSVEDCRDQIIVIPHAGVEYFEHSKVAKLTICEVGGPGSHLAINASEYKINLCMIENAMKIFDKTNVIVDLNNGTFKDKFTF